MKNDPVGESTFIVSSQETRGDLATWAIDHPAVLGEGFEILSTWIPLPDGGEIPILGANRHGALCVADVIESETETFYRLGRIVSFLRSRALWLRRAFPESGLDPEKALHLVVLGDDFSPSFVDAMAGLAVSELVLLRVRRLESTDGRRMLLVEKERNRMKASEQIHSAGGLTAGESEFFRRLAEERESMKPQEEAG